MSYKILEVRNLTKELLQEKEGLLSLSLLRILSDIIKVSILRNSTKDCFILQK